MRKVAGCTLLLFSHTRKAFRYSAAMARRRHEKRCIAPDGGQPGLLQFRHRRCQGDARDIPALLINNSDMAPSAPAAATDLIAELAEILPPGGILTDPAGLFVYESDGFTVAK